MTNKTTRTRTEAKKLMWEYYKENKKSLPGWIRECREEVLKEIQSGLSARFAFDRILEDVNCDAVGW